MDFRKVILERLKLDACSIYRSRRLRGEVGERTLYDYLNGKTDTSTKVLAAILDVLQLEVRPSSSVSWYVNLRNWEKSLPREKHWSRRRQMLRRTARSFPKSCQPLSLCDCPFGLADGEFPSDE